MDRLEKVLKAKMARREIFGERAMLNAAGYTSSVRTVTAVDVMALSREEFNAILDQFRVPQRPLQATQPHVFSQIRSRRFRRPRKPVQAFPGRAASAPHPLTQSRSPDALQRFRAVQRLCNATADALAPHRQDALRSGRPGRRVAEAQRTRSALASERKWRRDAAGSDRTGERQQCQAGARPAGYSTT